MFIQGSRRRCNGTFEDPCCVHLPMVPAIVCWVTHAMTTRYRHCFVMLVVNVHRQGTVGQKSKISTPPIVNRSGMSCIVLWGNLRKGLVRVLAQIRKILKFASFRHRSTKLCTCGAEVTHFDNPSRHLGAMVKGQIKILKHSYFSDIFSINTYMKQTPKCSSWPQDPVDHNEFDARLMVFALQPSDRTWHEKVIKEVKSHS